jgi:hypothetical protein
MFMKYEAIGMLLLWKEIASLLDEKEDLSLILMSSTLPVREG